MEKGNDTLSMSLIIATRALGIHLDMRILKDNLKIRSDERLQRNQLKGLKKHYKVLVHHHACSFPELKNYDIPMIAIMNNHEHVVIGRNDEEKLLLVNPLNETMEVVLRDQFEEHWSGQVYILKPCVTFETVWHKYHGDWFWQGIRPFIASFREVIAASIFLQILSLVLPLSTQVVMDKVVGNQGESTLYMLLLGLLFVAVFQAGMTYLRTYFSVQATTKMDVVLGARLMNYLLALPLPYFERRRVGDTLMRMGALSNIRDVWTGSGPNAFLDTSFAIILLAVMVHFSPMLTIVVLASFIAYLAWNIIVTPLYQKSLEKMWAAGAKNNSMLVESVAGIETIKALAVEPNFRRKWEELTAQTIGTGFANNKLALVVNNGQQLIQGATTLAILWLGGHLVMERELTIGQLIAFQMMTGQVTGPVLRTFSLWQTVQQAGLAAVRLGDILSSSRETMQGQKMNRAFQGQIVFDKVSFRYSPDRPFVLKQISFVIPSGFCVGIVGFSGSGKSTLAKLLQKFYHAETGQIFLDGTDIRQISPYDLRKQIGFVAQDNAFFAGTIRDNIALSHPQAPVQEVVQAAQLACAHDFILKTEEGYDTFVGERGTALSGGQRQRLAIARVLLNRPEILILDEATSALDNATEQKVIQNLRQVMKGKTTLMIAHRLSTLRQCDLIIVLEQGRILEEGTHSELLQQQGLYYELWKEQEGTYAEKVAR